MKPGQVKCVPSVYSYSFGGNHDRLGLPYLVKKGSCSWCYFCGHVSQLGPSSCYIELSIWIIRGIMSHFKDSWSASVFESSGTWRCVLCDPSLTSATISHACLAMIASFLSPCSTISINDFGYLESRARRSGSDNRCLRPTNDQS